MSEANKSAVITEEKQESAKSDFREIDPEKIASTEEVKINSEHLMKQNMEAYKALAKG